jgi:hypothetical protein
MLYQAWLVTPIGSVTSSIHAGRSQGPASMWYLPAARGRSCVGRPARPARRRPRTDASRVRSARAGYPAAQRSCVEADEALGGHVASQGAP